MALRADHVDLDRDRALVQRFQAGDDDAFGELYRRYHHRLERFCLKRVGDQHAAEEIAQEAFTRALVALPAFGGERHFYAWVSVIASRLCVDHHRRQARRTVVTALDPAAIPGGEDEVVEAVDDAIVVEAMSRLGPRHQDVLHLREVEGWSYRHIADHYGVPVGTVETLLFRARRALRREFRVIDGAGLVAVPIVGWLVQLIARARDRVAPMATLADAPAGLAAAAAVTMAAAVVMVTIPGLGPTPDATRRPPAVVAPAGPSGSRPVGTPSPQAARNAAAATMPPGSTAAPTTTSSGIVLNMAPAEPVPDHQNPSLLPDPSSGLVGSVPGATATTAPLVVTALPVPEATALVDPGYVLTAPTPAADRGQPLSGPAALPPATGTVVAGLLPAALVPGGTVTPAASGATDLGTGAAATPNTADTTGGVVDPVGGLLAKPLPVM
jgi:RNA polymerase sigma factor (sigma-70 family)